MVGTKNKIKTMNFRIKKPAKIIGCLILTALMVFFLPCDSWQSQKSKPVLKTPSHLKNETQTTLTIAMSRDLPPLSFLNATGQPAGIFVDIWRLWAEKTGRKIAFRLMPWAETIKGLKQGEADIHAGLFEAENRAGWIRFSRPIYGVGIRAYFPVKKGIISSIQELAGQKVGVTQGSHIESYVRDRYPEVNVAALRSTEEAVYAAREGTIAAFVGVDPVVSAILTRLGLQGEFESTPEPLYTRTFRAGVLKENTELAPVIDKGLDNISIDELARIEARWIPDRDKRYYKPAEKRIRLTAAERAWLKAHPDIVLGYNNSFEPTAIVDPDGSYRGIVVDFLDALNKRLGIHIALRIDSVPIVHAKAKAKETDGIALIHPDYADKLGFLKTKTYYRSYPTVFGLNDISFEQPDNFVGKKVAIIDKVYFSETIIHPYKDRATVLKVKDAREGLDMVYRKKADLFFGISANNYLITKHRLFGIAPKYVFFESLNKFGMAIRPDWPILVSILNKGISSFSEEELNAIVAKWIQPPQQKKQIELTLEEQAWLKAHPDIVLGYTDTFEPEVIVNPDGSYRGIMVDFLDELNQRLGTSIRLRIDPIPELVEKTQKKEVDGILSLTPGYADKLGLLKTRSHFTNYPTVFARKGVSFKHPSNLADKRVAIIDKVFFSEQIVEQYGDGATILKVKDALEGLQRVEQGKADFFLGASLNAYLITKYQLFDLATQYVFYDYPINAVIGTRSDWPELVRPS